MAGIRHVRLDRSQGEPSTNPIFVGPVSTQEVVNESHGDLLRVTAVTFDDGAVNRPHRHTTDALEPGDVAFISAGTRHWHGANANTSFTHLSILTPGHTEIDDAESR
jgi:quercetin dioxygenase-like cupin family protein